MSQQKLSDQTLILTPELRAIIDSVSFAAAKPKSDSPQSTELQQVVVSASRVWASDSYRLCAHDAVSNVTEDFPIPISALANIPKDVEVAIYAEVLPDRIALSWKTSGKIDQANAVRNPKGDSLMARTNDGQFFLTVYRQKLVDALKAMKGTKVVSLGETVIMDADANSKGYAVSPQIAFDRMRMVEGLRWFDDEVLTVHYGFGYEPIIMRSGPKSYFLMPFRIDSDYLLFSSEYRQFLASRLEEDVSGVESARPSH